MEAGRAFLHSVFSESSASHFVLMFLLTQELQDVEAGRAFGASLDLKAVGQPLGPDTLVPGVAVYRCA